MISCMVLQHSASLSTLSTLSTLVVTETDCDACVCRYQHSRHLPRLETCDSSSEEESESSYSQYLPCQSLLLTLPDLCVVLTVVHLCFPPPPPSSSSQPLNMEEKWFSPHVAYTMAKFGMSM